MMEPKFEPVLPLQPSDPLSARIADVMGTDYQSYIQCRNTDSKAISYLIGKSADRFTQHSVDWGRPVSDGPPHDRPRVDRSSGLYLTGTRKSVAPANKDHQPRGWDHDRKHQSGLPAYESAEDELRNDLYLSPSDDEETPGLNCTPNNSQHSAHDSQHASGTTGIRDLSYWAKKGSEKLEKKASQPSDAAPGERKPAKQQHHHHHQQQHREPPAAPASPKSESENYRELVKNGLDSLRSALRTGRMLSVLNDTDDEGPSGERKEWRPPPPASAAAASDTAKSSAGEWKSRKNFVDCRLAGGRSPKRELVPYSDLNEEEEEEEEEAKEVKKASPAKRKQKEVKEEEVFRFESRSAPFHIAFPVPPTGAASPSHRKRPRRHQEASPEPRDLPPGTGAFDVASTASPATDPMVDPNFERNLSDLESDAPASRPNSPPHALPSPAPPKVSIPPEGEKKPASIFHALPKIPRKRPNAADEAAAEAKKKPRMMTGKDEVSSPIKTEEVPPRDTTKSKESKKTRHKSQRKSKEAEPIKREPVSPRVSFEMSVSDDPQPSSLAALNGAGLDSLAPSLPRVTEAATQCELMPAVDRDASETKDTKRLRAVAFRIAGGQARAGTSAGDAAAGGSGSSTAAAAAVTRRPSSASTVDEGEAGGGGRRDGEDTEEARSGGQRCAGPSPNDLLDAVMRHKRQQESIVQRENVYYQKMNAHSCFSDAVDKKVEAERLKNDDPSRFALCALRACYLYIQACYVEERQSKCESASIHYREAVAYVRSTSQLIEQVAKSEPSLQRGRVRHNFITLLCAQMKAIINYRIYCIGHRETARLRPEIERELHRLTNSASSAPANGASERSTPESISRSPAVSQGLHLTGESLNRLQRYFRYSRAVQTAHEYWIHAMTLRQKHEELGPLEELVFRKSQVVCYGPECPVPCFLRYLNTFLTLYEDGEV